MTQDEKFIPKVTRRSFLNYVLGASGAALLGTLLYPVIRFLKPLPRAGASGPVRLSAEELAKLEKDRFVIVPVEGKRVLVFQGAGEKLVALDAKCTHEGCTVQFLPGESVIWCACHNARYDEAGQVLSGPAPRPLAKYTAEHLEDGGILVSTEGPKSG